MYVIANDRWHAILSIIIYYIRMPPNSQQLSATHNNQITEITIKSIKDTRRQAQQTRWNEGSGLNALPHKGLGKKPGYISTIANNYKITRSVLDHEYI